MSQSPDSHPTSTGKCTGCGKDSYRSRRAARTAAKHHHPGHPLRAYECLDAPVDGVWHYGHIDRLPPQPSLDPIRPAPAEARAAMAAVAARVKPAAT